MLLVADGPSGVGTQDADVAVNFAIREGARIWAVGDGPAKVWEHVDHDRAREADEVWTQRRNAKAWRDVLDADVMGVLRPVTVATQRRSNATTPMALATLGEMGVVEVDLRGVDMSGTGSPYTPWNEWSPEETRAQAFRWRREREAIAAVAASYGMTLRYPCST